MEADVRQPGLSRPGARGGAAFAVAAVLVWAAAFHLRAPALWYPDACDYAQLGRQIVRGEGFTSLQGFPYVLSWLREHGHSTAPPWPNITRFPLPPVTRALSLRLFGASDFSAMLPDAAFFSATAAMCFVLARRLAGGAAGWSAAVLVLSSPTMLQYALSGLSETAAGWFVLATAFALAGVAGGRDESSRWKGVIAVGCLLGLGFLQRSNLVLGLAPAMFVIVFRSPAASRTTRVAMAAVCVGATLLVCLPWFVRNGVWFGSPALSLTVDRNIAHALLQRDVFYELTLVDSGQILLQHMDAIVARLRWPGLLERGRELFGTDLAVLALAALVLTPLARLGGAGRSLRLYAWVLLLLTYVLSAPLVIHYEPRYYVPFAPLFACLVSVCAASMLRRVHPRLGPLLLVALSTTVAAWWLTQDFGGQVRSRDAQLLKWDGWIAEAVAGGEVVASDMSWDVAWHADRPTVRFYGDARQLGEIEQGYTTIAAVWLSKPSAARFERTLAEQGTGSHWHLVRRTNNGHGLWLRQPHPPARTTEGLREGQRGADPGLRDGDRGANPGLREGNRGADPGLHDGDRGANPD